MDGNGSPRLVLPVSLSAAPPPALTPIGVPEKHRQAWQTCFVKLWLLQQISDSRPCRALCVLQAGVVSNVGTEKVLHPRAAPEVLQQRLSLAVWVAYCRCRAPGDKP